MVVVGPTASGKSAVAMDIAKQFNGEIIAADSRTIYKGMDIGTAKPTLEDRRRVPHHLINIVDPNESFTAADFKVRALQSIKEITARCKLPIMVGGTGLYIDAVLFNFMFQPLPDPALRRHLQVYSVEQLQTLLKGRGIPLPANTQNRRHLMRRIETGAPIVQAKQVRPHTLVIGMQAERDMLKARIAERIATMFAAGLPKEAEHVAMQYGWRCAALKTIGYREFEPYFQGLQTLEEVEGKINADTNAYAKRQRTWFARNKSIHWVCDRTEVEDLITTFLSK